MSYDVKAPSPDTQAILLLCATMGTEVRVEVSGADEEQALAAVTSVFDSDEAHGGSEPTD